MEIWKATHIRSDYEVSNFGNIRRVKRDASKRYGQYSSIKPFHQRYDFVRINGKAYTVHRLVAIAFVPNSENKPYVCHKDNNTKNNSAENLYWGTGSENTKQAYKDNLINHQTPFVKILECPHCKKTSNYPNAKRWHFDNCKHKITRP
jgi:hypothetical protein